MIFLLDYCKNSIQSLYNHNIKILQGFNFNLHLQVFNSIGIAKFKVLEVCWKTHSKCSTVAVKWVQIYTINLTNVMHKHGLSQIKTSVCNKSGS